MIKQPAYKKIDKRIIGSLKNSDKAMNDSFWIGVWPGLNKSHLIFTVDIIKNFLRNEN
jgi:CDP-6-deoxy-D-xylo-4-hexulose-3-dehydrase